MKPCSDFLFARPSFLEGVARIMDFGNTLNEYNYSESDEAADEIALRMDWAIVGDDLRDAIEGANELLLGKGK
ncbi:MAG: hypothetical protein HY668_01020 [Chloroflexi bacterium]|nr:hypothetical protein [Chloroflexota bacterium]